MKIHYQSSRYNGMSLLDEIKAARRAGVDGFDVFFDGYLPSDLSEAEKRALREWQAEGGSLSIHFPIENYLKEPDFLTSILNFIVSFKPLAGVIHFDELEPEVQAMIISRCREAGGEGFKLCVENTIPDKHRVSAATYLEYMTGASKAAGTKAEKAAIHACLDSGHAFVNGQDPAQTMDKILSLGIDIPVFHIHDNDGNSDAHLALGLGKIDYRKLISQAAAHGIEPILVIEHWTGNDTSLAVLKEILR